MLTRREMISLGLIGTAAVVCPILNKATNERIDYPKKVRVGVFVFTILWKAIPKYSGHDAEVDFDECTIKIADKLSLEQEQESLCHEIYHVIADNGSRVLTDSGGRVCEQQKYLEHQWIEICSPAWLRVLKDNPDVLKFLLQSSW